MSTSALIEQAKQKFLEEIQNLPKDLELRKQLVFEMRTQGEKLSNLVLDALTEYFGEYTVFSVEEKLYEKIEDEDEYNFKGFIDLVVKTPDGKYHVIDWKTCSWGWDSRKKAEKMITYQLTFYKHFFAKKHNIDPEQIDTHFALLKRTAKHNNIELFKVSNGAKKTQNALKLLNKAIYNVKKKNYVKNKISCHGRFGTCEFYKTKHCP